MSNKKHSQKLLWILWVCICVAGTWPTADKTSLFRLHSKFQREIKHLRWPWTTQWRNLRRLSPFIAKKTSSKMIGTCPRSLSARSQVKIRTSASRAASTFPPNHAASARKPSLLEMVFTQVHNKDWKVHIRQGYPPFKTTERSAGLWGVSTVRLFLKTTTQQHMHLSGAYFPRGRPKDSVQPAGTQEW